MIFSSFHRHGEKSARLKNQMACQKYHHFSTRKPQGQGENFNKNVYLKKRPKNFRKLLPGASFANLFVRFYQIRVEGGVFRLLDDGNFPIDASKQIQEPSACGFDGSGTLHFSEQAVIWR